MNPPHSPRLAKISELARVAGVPAPTIKHYMREGLLPPPVRRTSRNMAWYDIGLAERVRVIKDLQQKHFLPLRIIGDILEPAPSAALRGDLHETVRRQIGSLEPAVREGHSVAQVDRPPRTRTRADVLATLDIDDAELDYLTEIGLIEASSQGGGEPEYAGADLDILEVIHETRENGLGDLFGMEVLGPYLESVRSVARLELELFRERVLTESALPEGSRAEIARQAVGLGARLLVAMRNKLIISELRGLAERASVLPPPPTASPARRAPRARRPPR